MWRETYGAWIASNYTDFDVLFNVSEDKDPGKWIIIDRATTSETMHEIKPYVACCLDCPDHMKRLDGKTAVLWEDYMLADTFKEAIDCAEVLCIWHQFDKDQIQIDGKRRFLVGHVIVTGYYC